MSENQLNQLISKMVDEELRKRGIDPSQLEDEEAETNSQDELNQQEETNPHLDRVKQWLNPEYKLEEKPQIDGNKRIRKWLEDMGVSMDDPESSGI